MDHVSVKYIGKRPVYLDGTFGTRILFKHGESRNVPKDKALLMLKHPDVYVPGVADAPIAVVPAIQTEADNTQDLRDSVSAMNDKAALSDFTHIKYGIKLDKRKPIEELRIQAVGLIDQYGAN